jgi:hypothetical protein
MSLPAGEITPTIFADLTTAIGSAALWTVFRARPAYPGSPRKTHSTMPTPIEHRRRDIDNRAHEDGSPSPGG